MLVWQVGPSKPRGHEQLWKRTHSLHPHCNLNFVTWIRFQSSASSPVLPLLLLHLAGSSIGTWVTHTGIQSCLTVLALRQGKTNHIYKIRIIHIHFYFCYILLYYFKPLQHMEDIRRLVEALWSSDLESWRTAAPVDLHRVAVTNAVVQTGTGQTGVTLGQHGHVHITWEIPGR